MPGYDWLANSMIVEALGWTLVHSIWEGVFVAIVLALVLRIMRARSARARYLVAMGMMVLLPVCAVATCGVLIGLLNRQTATMTVREIEGKPILLSSGNTLIPMPTRDRPILPAHVPTWNQRLRSLLPWLVLIWVVGVIVLGLYQFAGWIVVRRLRNSGVALEDDAGATIFDELTKRLRINRPVRLMRSALVQVPTVIGHLRPLVLLPINALTGLSTDQLRGLLAHELAHVQRYDYLVNISQTIIETLLFYHPAVWWMGRVIRQERENACDDLAAEVCDRRTYAQALAAMESLRASPMPALGARDGVLLPRIRRILGLPTVARRRSIWSVVVLFSLVATLAIPSLIACRNTHAADARATTQPTTGPANEFANATPPTDEDLKVIDEPYRIMDDDQIEVSVGDFHGAGTTFRNLARVQISGNVALPSIPEVKARGETTKELEKLLADQYQTAAFVKKGATVSVKVTEAHGRTFSILGASNQPGQYVIPKKDFHLLDALSMSNGISAKADDMLYVLRDDPAAKSDDKKRVIKIARAALESGDASQNIVIRTDDLILVRPRETANLDPANHATTQAADGDSVRQVEPSAKPAHDLDPTRELLVARRDQLQKQIAELQRSLNKEGTTTQPSEFADKDNSPQVQLDKELFEFFKAKQELEETETRLSILNLAAINGEATQSLTDAQGVVVPSTDQIEKLREQLVQTSLALQQLQSQVGPQNPRAVQMQAQIQKLQVELTAEELALKNSQAATSTTTQPTAHGEYYISGVERTGVYSLNDRKINVRQALIAAGFTDALRNCSLVIVRANPAGGEIRKSLAVNDIMDTDAGQAEVQAGDVLMVTAPITGEYYVGGNVPRTGVYSLTGRQINLLQALISAGADPQELKEMEVEVRRRTPDKKEEVFRYTVPKLLEKTGEPFILAPDDLITVQSPKANTAAHFVRLVIGKDRMTFEGNDVTWETLEPELKKVPSRADTALELSIANEEITIGQQNKARGMCIGLVNDLGFKYLTETGVHALGSKGGDNSPATQPVQSK